MVQMPEARKGRQRQRSNDCAIRWRSGFLEEIISCHNCGKKGHLKRECLNKMTNKGGEQVHANIEDDPNEGENIFVIIEGENIFVQAGAKVVVNKNFLLLDNQSTVNQITNPSLPKNIWKSSKPLTVHCMLESPRRTLKENLAGWLCITTQTALQMCCPSSLWQRCTE